MSTAREYSYQMVHFMRYTFDSSDDETAKTIGYLPAGAVVLKSASGANVNTAFNGGTTVVSIGITGSTQKFASALSCDTADFVECDTTGSFHVGSSNIAAVATLTMTGAAQSAGEVEVILAYVPDNDG